jgi:hypothetical protein
VAPYSIEADKSSALSPPSPTPKTKIPSLALALLFPLERPLPLLVASTINDQRLKIKDEPAS